MIKKELFCDTLDEFYRELRHVQQEKHGDDYTLVHNEISKCLEECESYTEFGIMQGPTLAIACLADVKKIRAYDISLRWYNKSAHLFNQYTSENNINFKVIEESTLTCTIDPVDLLYIDSRHEYNHLKQELARHALRVRTYIIMHDTTNRPELVPAIDEFLKANPKWERITECKESVGFTTLRKIQ